MSADSLYKEAEKKANKTFFKDYEGAAKLFADAATHYKLAKDYGRAGESYMRAAECAIKGKDNFSASGWYADSANAYKKVDMKEAAKALDLAVSMQIDNNRLGGAARLVKEYADALVEQGSSEAALPHYEKAMNYFNAEDQKAQAQNCMIAMARIYGELDKFEKSLMYYERIANNMLGGPLKFQAQTYFINAMLCQFAMVNNDNRFEKSEECSESLQNYLAADMYLKGTREADFLELILDAVANCDIDKFEQGVSLLQDIKKLDDWRTHVLLVVKHNMESLT